MKMNRNLSLLVSSSSQVSALSIFPIHNFPNLFHKVHTNILIVDIVGVLPNVNSCMQAKILKRGVRPAGASIYWLGRSKTRKLFAGLSYASHPQPEPWMGMVFFVNSSIKFSKEPNCFVTAWEKGESAGGYSPPPWPIGARFYQKIEWLMWPPRLNLIVWQRAAILL